MKTPPPITSPYAPDVAHLRAWLEKMIAALRFVEIVAAVVALIARMRDVNTELTKQLAQMRRGRPRSETLDRLQRQLLLPLETPSSPVPDKAKDVPATGAQSGRRGRHPGRAALPAHLERVRVVNAVPPNQRICPLCGSEMTTVGHSKCEILDVVPARVIVIERLDERVACPYDDAIVSAATPPAIVDRGKLGDDLIIEALADKYIEHQPVERQCVRWARAGVDIAPQTLGRSIAAAIDLLAPVARLIEEQTRSPGLLATDATGIPVLDPDAPMGIRNGAMWCWTNARWVSFFYSPSGDSDSVRRFLGEDLARTVQCDGTSVTTFVERVGGKRPGCWSHGRRRLVDAASMGDAVALEGLHLIAPLFAIERAATRAGDNADARRARRAEHSVPVLEKLRALGRRQAGAHPTQDPARTGARVPASPVAPTRPVPRGRKHRIDQQPSGARVA